MQIKQFELSEKSALLSFLAAAYEDNPRMSDERFWNWHFLENPYTNPDDMPIWIAKEGTEIVAQLAATQIKLKIGKQEKPAMWILDLIVRPDFRRKGLGKKLVAEAEKFCPFGLGINTAEQHSTALLESIGWKMIGRIPRYNKLLFPGEALREISRIKAARQISNFIFAPFRPRLVEGFFNQNKNLRFIEKFDASFDDLWREASTNWSCAIVRRKEILKWQFSNQPNKKFNVLSYYNGDKLLGYIVLYFRKKDSNDALPKAAISDLCYHSSNSVETIDALIQGALQIALENRAGALVTDILDPLVEKSLRKAGFTKVKNPLQLLVKTSEHQDEVENLRNWFVTRGDSDTSIFEQPNF
jgi:GNAT superfamily N-acetyltransferase